MDRASVFAHPARYEPFGLAPLEAARAGCALVLGDIPSLRENWDAAALFVPPGDTQALTQALADLCANGSRREELAARAHERAQHFTPRRMAAGYREAYRRARLRAAAQLTKEAAECGT